MKQVFMESVLEAQGTVIGLPSGEPPTAHQYPAQQ